MSGKISEKGYSDICTWHEQIAYMKRLYRIIARMPNSEQTVGTALRGACERKGQAYKMKTDFKSRAFERKGRKGDTFVSV